MSKIQRQDNSGKSVQFCKLEGFIDNDRRSFMVTNYDECVANGLLGYIEPPKSVVEKDKQYANTQELFKKYRPQFYK